MQAKLDSESKLLVLFDFPLCLTAFLSASCKEQLGPSLQLVRPLARICQVKFGGGWGHGSSETFTHSAEIPLIGAEILMVGGFQSTSGHGRSTMGRQVNGSTSLEHLELEMEEDSTQ